jgi:PKHD-type hydroxylase
MIVRIPGLIGKDLVAQCREVLEKTPWVDGRITAGVQSARTKNNLQVPETSEEARALGEIILGALGRNEAFVSAALPLRVFPPLFNRYDAGMRFGPHVDNAIRFSAAGGVRFRTDVSATLFLTEPEEYDGGELIIQDTFGEHAIKLGAGDLIIYPAVSVHRVEPVTRGARWSSFFWLQSMIRDDGQRALLYDLDRSISGARAALSDDHHTVVELTAVYHNLVRRWADV